MIHTICTEGSFNFDKPLSQEHFAYLRHFSLTKRIKRNENHITDIPDPLRLKVELPYGIDCEYFVGGEIIGQVHDWSAESYYPECPPGTQPYLWCDWIVSNDGTTLLFNSQNYSGNLNYYINWLIYMIKHFFDPWGYILNGEVSYQSGQNYGKIAIYNNSVNSI
jgi:hypothetical protein